MPQPLVDLGGGAVGGYGPGAAKQIRTYARRYARRVRPQVSRRHEKSPPERRPVARRTRSTSVSSRDGPGSDESDLPLARLRGFAAANEKLYVHVARRLGAKKAATA